MVTDASERKAKREQTQFNREERIEERKDAKEKIRIEREEKPVDRAVLTTIIVSAVGGHFEVQEKNKRKRETKNNKGQSA